MSQEHKLRYCSVWLSCTLQNHARPAASSCEHPAITTPDSKGACAAQAALSALRASVNSRNSSLSICTCSASREAASVTRGT
jgi:hypothetical protein